MKDEFDEDEYGRALDELTGAAEAWATAKTMHDLAPALERLKKAAHEFAKADLL